MQSSLSEGSAGTYGAGTNHDGAADHPGRVPLRRHWRQGPRQQGRRWAKSAETRGEDRPSREAQAAGQRKGRESP